MGTTTTNRLRTRVAVLVGALVLAVVVTACGSGSGGDTSTGNDPTTTVAGTGVGRAITCAAKAELFSAAVAKVTNPAEGESASVKWSTMVDDLVALTPSLPSSIRDDWTVYVDAMRTAADAMATADTVGAGTDPEMAARLAAAADALGAPAVAAAIESIYEYFATLCRDGE